jgi:hypothetical protein
MERQDTQDTTAKSDREAQPAVSRRGDMGLGEEIDIFEFSERGAPAPDSPAYHVRIDGETVRIETPTPKGKDLLQKVGKRPCAFELIEEFRHRENDVVEPDESVDLRKHGLKGFITAHKEIVTIFLNGDAVEIERGKRTVAEILYKARPVPQSPDAYDLLEEKDGPPLPVPDNRLVAIHGCEVFHSQPKSGASS